MPPTSTTHLITDAAEVRATVIEAQRAGETIGLVPTMGALHAGHLSLVDASLAECDRTIVSIFVNPTQFGPQEDLQNYPTSPEQDFAMLKQRGCWLVFSPSREEVYRANHETFIDVGSVARLWEGKSRPDHFRGVATVVLKLLQMVPADRAYFGQKDYQQTLVVRQMMADLNVPTEIRVCPIVREPDGLAMSSRNAYLSSAQRRQATGLWKSLQLAANLHADGETDANKIRQAMKTLIDDQGGIELEYIAFLAQNTVCEVDRMEGPTVVAIAARVGKTRLIDNCLLG